MQASHKYNVQMLQKRFPRFKL